MSKTATLLVNLGSPDSTSIPDVRTYLTEFLSDDRVIDSPKLIQQFVLRCFILPKRPKESAHAYSTIWTAEGSPLVVLSRKLQALVQEQVDLPVHLAMRYGNPSIPDTIDKLASNGVEHLYLIPLYPHYAMSSYETVVVRVREVAREKAPAMRIDTLPPFFDDPDYIEALYESSRTDLESGYDHVLFSYHSIPERHLRKADSSRAHCTIVADCCNNLSPAHATCYRAQTVKTTRLFTERAGIPRDKWSIAFQSRLEGEPWLQPYTDKALEELGRRGTRRLLVMTASFVSDCLETLEEIAVRGKETFVEAGGGDFKQIPCMNENPLWVKFLSDRINAWNGAAQPQPA